MWELRSGQRGRLVDKESKQMKEKQEKEEVMEENREEEEKDPWRGLAVSSSTSLLRSLCLD